MVRSATGKASQCVCLLVPYNSEMENYAGGCPLTV